MPLYGGRVIRWGPWTLVAVVVTAVVCAGCSGGAAPTVRSDSAPPVTTTAPTTTAPSLSAEPARLVRLCGTDFACDDFASPTGNLYCFASEAQGGYLECDSHSPLQPTPPRGSCDLDQPGVMLSRHNAGAVSCRSDPTPAGLDQHIPVLPYGHVWQGYGFSCTSSTAGITCRRGGHRFFISRERWTVS